MGTKRNKRRTGATLSDVKGADLLAKLASALAPDRPSVTRPPATTSVPIEKALADHASRDHRQRPPSPPQRSEKKRPSEPIRVKLSAAERLRIFGSSAEPAYKMQAAPVVPNDFGQGAFSKIAQLRPALSDFLADHRAPEGASSDVADVVIRRIARCVERHAHIVNPDAEGFLGYDFGTSSTKAVIRWPYRASSPAHAISVPAGWCSGGQPHIWPSVVFYDPVTQQFSVLPAIGSMRVDGFKAALVEGTAHRMAPGAPVTLLEAAVAFLSLHLAYVLGTIDELDGQVSLVNVAIPVAALDRDEATVSGRAQAAFDHAVRSALRLLHCADSLTLHDVRAALASLEDPSLDYELHPELSGVIAGYCRGPRHYLGTHMIIDCGSATLDMATFKLDKSDWPLEIYAASVELLGSDASVTYCNAGATTEDCARAARYQDYQVCSRSIQLNRTGFSQTDGGKLGYQVILAGGGIANPWIASMLEKWQLSFERDFVRPRLDPNLKCEMGFTSERLVLADGLARDPVDLKRVSLPRRPVAELTFNPNHHDWTSN